MTIDLTGGLDLAWENVFTAQPEHPEMHESINAWIWDDSGRIGLPRIGVEAIGNSWETHGLQVNVAFPDGRVYNIFGGGPKHDPRNGKGEPRVLGAGPLVMEVMEPYRHVQLRLDGEALATTTEEEMDGWMPFTATGDKVPISARIDIHPCVPPWMNGGLRPEALHLLQTTEEGDLMGYPWRFEQLCRASGTVTIDGTTHAIDGHANRIRRQSIRRTATLRGHCWQAAVFPSGRAFGYIAYPPYPDGRPTYNEGYTFAGDGSLVPAEIVDMPLLRSLQASGQDVSVTVRDAEGDHRIHGETQMSTFMVMPPEGGGLQLQQAIVRYTWDGETAMGMLERSMPGETLT